MWTFVLFWISYFLMSIFLGAQLTYAIMVPVSFALIVLALSKVLTAIVMAEFAKFAATRQHELNDAIVIQARGLDS
jgi:hypothetical protein